MQNDQNFPTLSDPLGLIKSNLNEAEVSNVRATRLLVDLIGLIESHINWIMQSGPVHMIAAHSPDAFLRARFFFFKCFGAFFFFHHL